MTQPTSSSTLVWFDGKYRMNIHSTEGGAPNQMGKDLLEFLLVANSRRGLLKGLTNSKVALEGTSIKPAVSHHGALALDETKAYGNGILEGHPPREDFFLPFSKINPSYSAKIDWVYVIDLDQHTFEIYLGKIKHPFPAGERFHHDPQRVKGNNFPAKHLKTYKLDRLPKIEVFPELLEILAGQSTYLQSPDGIPNIKQVLKSNTLNWIESPDGSWF